MCVKSSYRLTFLHDDDDVHACQSIKHSPRVCSAQRRVSTWTKHQFETWQELTDCLGTAVGRTHRHIHGAERDVLPTTLVVQVEQRVRCVGLSVTFERNDLRFQNIWNYFELSRSSRKVKVIVQSSWSHEEKCS